MVSAILNINNQNSEICQDFPRQAIDLFPVLFELCAC